MNWVDMKVGAKIFFILLLGWIAIGCTSQQEEPSGTGPVRENKTEYPDQESWESTITITKDGRKVAIVWAAYIAAYNKRNETLLKDSIHVDFFDREGQHNSVLTAREGIVQNSTRNLRAIGDVVVISDSGIVLETDELIWDNQRQKIISELPVKFTTMDDTLVGDSFISDPDLANYEIRNARGYSKRIIPLEK